MRNACVEFTFLGKALRVQSALIISLVRTRAVQHTNEVALTLSELEYIRRPEETEQNREETVKLKGSV